jgi:hypothetical protein
MKARAAWWQKCIGALGALLRVQSKMKLGAEKKQETHGLSNKEKENWIDDFVKSDTAVAIKRVQDAETLSMQDMTTAEHAGATTGKP